MAGPFNEEDLRVIAECERILAFHDQVIAGTHPRVKVNPDLVSSSILKMKGCRTI